jgi:hypothetical protein
MNVYQRDPAWHFTGRSKYIQIFRPSAELTTTHKEQLRTAKSVCEKAVPEKVFECPIPMNDYSKNQRYSIE